jgi:hypothetical protein
MKRYVGNELAKLRTNRDSKIGPRADPSGRRQESRRPAKPEIELAIVIETKATNSNASSTKITANLFPRQIKECR